MVNESPLGSKILPALISQYKNIDIRGIFARTKGQNWYCVFLKIYLTKESKVTINDIHKNKHDLISTKDDNIRFLSDCLEVIEIYAILAEMSHKRITIQGESAGLHPCSQNIFDSNTVVYKSKDIIKDYITPQQSNHLDHVYLTVDGDETPYAALDRYGFNPAIYKYRNLYEDFRIFLDINVIVINRNLILIFPIYFRKVPLDVDEQMLYITKLEMHKALSEYAKCKIKLDKYGLDARMITNVQKVLNDELLTILVPRNDIEILQNDKLNIEVEIPDIQQSFAFELSYEDMISKNKVQTNQLAFAFKLFRNPSTNLERYVYSNAPVEQAAGTTWLLSLLGYQCIDLTFKGKDGRHTNEMLAEGRFDKQSVDILAYKEGKYTVVIDLTTQAPKQAKLDKIISAAKFIGEKLSIPVIPMIICSDYCPNTKDSGADLAIIDKSDLDGLLNRILANKIDEAKQLIDNKVIPSHDV